MARKKRKHLANITEKETELLLSRLLSSSPSSRSTATDLHRDVVATYQQADEVSASFFTELLSPQPFLRTVSYLCFMLYLRVLVGVNFMRSRPVVPSSRDVARVAMK